MQLYLMRHGEAVSPSEWSSSDENRPLTPIGRAKLESAVEAMKKLQFSFSFLLTSPLVRAKQTTEIFERAYSRKSEVSPDLAAGTTLAKLKSLILRFATHPSVLVVGHMPDLAVFGSRVSTEPSVLERGLRPGEILALETNLSNSQWGNGRILWYRSLDEWEKIKKI